MQGEAKTIPIRPGESFDVERVEQYLRQSNVELPNHPLAGSQFPNGHSNLTYLLTCGEWKAVLRRPPNGNLPPKAHDMQREAWILFAGSTDPALRGKVGARYCKSEFLPHICLL